MLYDLARVYFRPAGLTGAWTSLTGMGPETPAICPDTPGLQWFSYSEFMSEYSGLGSPDTPRICPDTPDFWSRVAHRPDRSDRFGIPV